MMAMFIGIYRNDGAYNENDIMKTIYHDWVIACLLLGEKYFFAGASGVKTIW